MATEWNKDLTTGVVSAYSVIGNQKYIKTALTVEELEEGLKLAREKPVFEAKDRYGSLVGFQKQDGRIVYRAIPNGAWVDSGPFRLTALTYDEIEAYLKARRS